MANLEPLEEEMKEKKNRNHGSTTLFVILDYLFLLIFFCFLSFFLLKMVGLWCKSFNTTVAIKQSMMNLFLHHLLIWQWSEVISFFRLCFRKLVIFEMYGEKFGFLECLMNGDGVLRDWVWNAFLFICQWNKTDLDFSFLLWNCMMKRMWCELNVIELWFMKSFCFCWFWFMALKNNENLSQQVDNCVFCY